MWYRGFHKKEGAGEVYLDDLAPEAGVEVDYTTARVYAGIVHEYVDFAAEDHRGFYHAFGVFVL